MKITIEGDSVHWSRGGMHGWTPVDSPTGRELLKKRRWLYVTETLKWVFLLSFVSGILFSAGLITAAAWKVVFGG